MLIGYARVSTQDQNLELQIEALTKAGCKKIFDDKISGNRSRATRADQSPGNTARKGHPGCLETGPAGSKRQNLVDLVELHKQGVQFKSLTDSIDTGTPSGRFFFHVMASLAEMERELTMERTPRRPGGGPPAARPHGWPQTPDDRQQDRVRQETAGQRCAPRDVAKNLGVSVPTLYRWIPAAASP